MLDSYHKQKLRERPILFSGPMVSAILAGRKSQTRRIARKNSGKHPYGSDGDRLWVREQHAIYRADGYFVESDWCLYRADDPTWRHPEGFAREHSLRWRPPIHMPRWASRIDLTITSVRREQLQEISGGDCIREGVWPSEERQLGKSHLAIKRYADLWDAMHAKQGHGWATNPMVWVIDFDVCHVNKENAIRPAESDKCC
ncbi:MAG: hypothetical protein HW380_679 [Magnetococcales bacterium]|nr:hypothetical protein [Magnetococcales bacterium]